MTNRNEQWKHEKDGLEILKELPALAEKDFKEIDPGDVERLKWAGIYAQRPRDGHFLVRVKLPSGQLTAAQAKVLVDLAAAYGKGEIQITIRQAVQIHNITLRDAVDILPRLKAAGLSSVEACGDVPRTILGNPLAGVDAEELLDTRPLVEEVFRFFLGNRDFSNLPRKFKISISANPHDAGFARINDLAFVPARREGEAGFVAYVGGGLSAEPHLAVRLPFFIRPAEVKAVAEAVARSSATRATARSAITAASSTSWRTSAQSVSPRRSRHRRALCCAAARKSPPRGTTAAFTASTRRSSRDSATSAST